MSVSVSVSVGQPDVLFLSLRFGLCGFIFREGSRRPDLMLAETLGANRIESNGDGSGVLDDGGGW